MGDADIQKLGDGGLERAESLFRSSSVLNFFNTYMSCRFKMGMNIAGGSLKVQQQAAAFGISAQDMVDERCSAASSCSAAASNTRADKLDLFSSKTGLPDGMGMNIAGGSLKVQQQAAAFGTSVQDMVDERRSAASSCSAAASNT